MKAAAELGRRWLDPLGLIRRQQVSDILMQVGMGDCELPDQILRRLNDPLFRRSLRRPRRTEPDAATGLTDQIAEIVSLLDEVITKPANMLLTLTGKLSPEARALIGPAERAQAALREVLALMPAEEPAMASGRRPTQASRAAAVLAVDVLHHAKAESVDIPVLRACKLARDLISLALPGDDIKDWLTAPNAAAVRDAVMRRMRNTRARAD